MIALFCRVSEHLGMRWNIYVIAEWTKQCVNMLKAENIFWEYVWGCNCCLNRVKSSVFHKG